MFFFREHGAFIYIEILFNKICTSVKARFYFVLNCFKWRLRRFRLHATALVDDEDPSPPDVWHQRGTLESNGDPTRLLRLADGARAESFGRGGDSGSADGSAFAHLLLILVVILQLILWDEKRIALAVAEAVEDRGAQALILPDPLDQRLRLTPVFAQIATFGDN